MSIEEKEERIIKLNEERLYLIKEQKEITKIDYRKNDNEDKYIILKSILLSQRIDEINQEIEELIASAKPNCS